MTCNKTSVGAWEAFSYTVVGTASAASVPLTAVEYALPEKADYGLYPNPVKGQNVNLHLGHESDENIQVSIAASDGNVVWEKTVNSVAELAVDISLKPGIYYVRILRGREKIVKRLVVE